MKSAEIGLGPRHGVMQELAGLAEPEAAIAARLRLRDEDIGREFDEEACQPGQRLRAPRQV